MHTRAILRFDHFRTSGAEGRCPLGFPHLCPEYHPQDRIAVVAPQLDAAVSGTARALLACTTAFYDASRDRGNDYFDYPQHFCILDADGQTVNTTRGRVEADIAAVAAAWSNLDVWPECKWHCTDGTSNAMLRKVFELQIDRVFWPEGFSTPDDDPPLPAYMRRTLMSHLKQVCYYNASEPTVNIHAGGPALELVKASLARLPGDDSCGRATGQELRPGADGFIAHGERFRQVSCMDFLAEHEALFR
jgi:hypothetical protein